MRRIAVMSMDAAIASLILVPVFFLLNHSRFKNIRKTTGYLIFSIYLTAMYAVVGLPDVCYIRYSPHFNWKPFAYMFSDYESSFLNVMLFIPMGFLLPCFWKRFSNFWNTITLGFLVSAGIETLQIFTYRATDVNDLITNTAGTVLGWIIASLMLKWIQPFPQEDDTRDLWLVGTTSFLVMFFLHPFLSQLIWMTVK